MATKIKKQNDKKKVYIMGGFIILLALVYAFQELSERGMSVMTDNSDFDKELKTLTQKQSVYQDLLNEYSDIQYTKEKLASLNNEFWIAEKHGDIKSTAHRLVEQSAKRAGLELSALGNLTEQKVDDGISLWTFSISTDSTMLKVASFMHELSTLKPYFNWSRCSLRPKSSKDPDTLHLQGTLMVTTLSDETLLGLLYPNGVTNSTEENTK